MRGHGNEEAWTTIIRCVHGGSAVAFVLGKDDTETSLLWTVHYHDLRQCVSVVLSLTHPPVDTGKATISCFLIPRSLFSGWLQLRVWGAALLRPVSPRSILC